MNNLKEIVLIICFLCLVSGIQAQQVYDVTLKSLLKEMTSRESITRFPEYKFFTRHVSSYDRSSTSPLKKNWFHNWDMNQWEGVEETKNGKEYVLMNVEAPGAITHFWMTGAGKNRGQGILRIYIDGNKEPVISQTIRSFIGENKEVGYPLSCSVSPLTVPDERGHNLYIPIPYARSCKVTYQSESIIDGNPWETKSEILYYNIDYREYDPETKIKSFTKKSIKLNRELIQATNQMLLEGGFRQENKVNELDKFKVTLVPGQELIVSNKNIGSAIHEINMRVLENNPTQSLRSLIIKCTFDNKQTIWVPIGDFFGAGYRIDGHETRYNKVNSNGTLTSKWLMPFNRSCKIALENVGEKTLEVEGSVHYSPYAWDEQSMYFHASWHQYTNLETGAPKNMLGGDGIRDLNFVTLKGKGVYVGDVLTLFNANLPPGKEKWTKEDGTFTYCWWGEGDEKIYIDGEVFPSHFGTGTEDYYNYAWCKPEKFSHPFIAQPSGEGNLTPGYTVNMRVRALDILPFNESLKFDMELWHWNKAIMNYAPTTFYYMRPGGKSNIEPDYIGVKEPVLLDFEKIKY
ncbi:Protein of unknown function [Zhouia amylolytica]|uniref:DUF2961 domain-containing protein n=1 Tax=Zhouia amylolytica TaxID=376730 RepID=A0A1I6T858_9FLAO|nr:glycoside hydrolase family 172 protein [Zhouia amylolytica]SFS85394.1 Protein of unknown function [Zhouia amylolytica]